MQTSVVCPVSAHRNSQYLQLNCANFNHFSSQFAQEFANLCAHRGFLSQLVRTIRQLKQRISVRTGYEYRRGLHKRHVPSFIILYLMCALTANTTIVCTRHKRRRKNRIGTTTLMCGLLLACRRCLNPIFQSIQYRFQVPAHRELPLHSQLSTAVAHRQLKPSPCMPVGFCRCSLRKHLRRDITTQIRSHRIPYSL